MALETGPVFPAHAASLSYARDCDAHNALRHLRDEYIQLPTRCARRVVSDVSGGDVPADAPDTASGQRSDDTTATSIYMCAHGLGLQPRAAQRYVLANLEAWATLGVDGHFQRLASAPCGVPWRDLAASCARQMNALVGADPAAVADEVVIMNGLTVNLQLMLASFYRPTATRNKILVEWRPFSSDSYAVDSHLRWHGLDSTALVEITPDHPDSYCITTARILAAIDDHANDAALLLLPGVHFLSGQLFDIPTITRHARAAGIVVGWDLAHAVGNVELRLHDWDVDFAVWCSYKYLNAGPGAIGGVFVHSRYGHVAVVQESTAAADSQPMRQQAFSYQDRLAGWYGCDPSVRFHMPKMFQPTPGAAGFQLSNPSALDLTSLAAALRVFDRTTMADLRRTSVALTAYAEHLLLGILRDAATTAPADPAPFHIISPANPSERGAQLSVKFRPGSLAHVSASLEAADIVFDAKPPDIIRFASSPMYNTFQDVFHCMHAVRRAVLP